MGWWPPRRLAPLASTTRPISHGSSRASVRSRAPLTACRRRSHSSSYQYLEQLDREITAHSDAAVAAGGEPIERPVVLCLDNHASRYSEEVLKAASGQSSRLGIRLFTEEPMTSGFLQSLDQYNATFHRRYNQGRDAYKAAYEARHKTPCTTYGMVEFVKVLAGDAELGLPGMWFSWANPFDIVTAWRNVGIAGNVLAPELIDRTEFIDQPAVVPVPSPQQGTPGAAGSPHATRKRAADLAKTPDGMVSGSLESERAKVQRLLAHAEELEAELDMPFNPTTGGVLVPTAVTRPDKAAARRGRKRLSDLHGSVTMRDVGGEAEKRRLEDEAKEEAAKEKKRQAAEKKEEASRTAALAISGFERCEHGCACGVVPCPSHVCRLEAVPGVWAQEGPVQGQGMLCSAQAALAGPQPGRGGIGGREGGRTGHQGARAYLRSRCSRLCEISLGHGVDCR